MYERLLFIQYVNLFAIFVETIIIFRSWRSYLHGWLFLCNIVQLVNAAGILLEYTSRMESSYITALRMSYLGRVWVALFMFLFVSELCGKRLSRILKYILIAIHAGIYVTVFTIPECTLFYSKYIYYRQGYFAYFKHTNGITHHIYTGLQIVYIIAGFVLLFMSLHKEKTRVGRRRLRMVIYAITAMTLSYVVQSVNLFPDITHVFDVTMIGYTIGTTFMYIAIFRYNLLGTEQIAKEYIVDKLSEGIIAADENGKVVFFNKPAQALYPELEKSASDVVGQLRDTIDKNEPILMNERVYTPKTDDLYRDGEVYGTVYMLHDNTELYRHARELEEMTERANAANNAKSQFLSNMSHEIRTPINAVLGMDEMILRESTESGIVSYAEDIRTAGRTLLSLINDILDLSKIEEGRMELIPAQYELGSMINDLVNMVRSRAEKKGLRLDVNVDPKIPHLLYGDEIRVKQCALNILTNAVKYTEKGSVTLTVGYSEREDGDILLSFDVKDTGIGMKPEDLEKLFAPFSRIEEQRNRTIEGTGLGMSITKQLLALMDSSLDVKSVYGEGSEFSFSVVQKVIKSEPVGDYSARYMTENKHTAYREMFRAPDARILVVDDTPVNLSVIKGLLKQTLVQTDTAASGKEALKLASETKYDIVYIDHMMPEMDGIETLHKLRELPGYENAVCVALTANAVSGARELYIEAGFSDYLSKPVDGERLEKLLMDILPPEKVTVVSGDGTETAEEGVKLPEQLGDIAEIDVDSGLAHCGTPDVYLETLDVYAGTGPASADEMEDMRRAGDIEGLTIKIHALKSTSRAIGAEELGALAEKLEFMGKAGDKAVLGEETEELISRYRSLAEALKGLSGSGESDGDKPLISDDMLRKAYDEIREFSDSFDIDGAALAIEALAKYRLPDSERERYEKLKEAADNFDWDAVAAIAGGR